jgi:hypothetical protein
VFTSRKSVVDDIFGRCFRTAFGCKASWISRALMAWRTSKGLVNVDSIAGAQSYARIASSAISMTAGRVRRVDHRPKLSLKAVGRDFPRFWVTELACRHWLRQRWLTTRTSPRSHLQ